MNYNYKLQQNVFLGTDFSSDFKYVQSLSVVATRKRGNFIFTFTKCTGMAKLETLPAYCLLICCLCRLIVYKIY